MLYICFTASNPAEAADGVIVTADRKALTREQQLYAITRNDLISFNDAKALVASVNRLLGQDKYVATDAGSGTYPRYDIVEKPAVGHEVSYGFNGDYYPCGKIAKVSKTLHMITTDTGHKFYRRGESAKWVMGGTWSMVRGHHSEQNPSF